MDEVAIQNLSSYKDKKFVDISKEDLDLGMNKQLTVSILLGYFPTTWDLFPGNDPYLCYNQHSTCG